MGGYRLSPLVACQFLTCCHMIPTGIRVIIVGDKQSDTSNIPVHVTFNADVKADVTHPTYAEVVKRAYVARPPGKQSTTRKSIFQEKFILLKESSKLSIEVLLTFFQEKNLPSTC